MIAAYAVIIVGGLLITRRLRLLALAATFWIVARRRPRRPCRVRPLHRRALVVRARLRVRLLASHRGLTRGPDLPVLHDHRPEDRPGGEGRAGPVRSSVAVVSVLFMAPQTDEWWTKVGLLAGRRGRARPGPSSSGSCPSPAPRPTDLRRFAGRLRPRAPAAPRSLPSWSSCSGSASSPPGRRPRPRRRDGGDPRRLPTRSTRPRRPPSTVSTRPRPDTGRGIAEVLGDPRQNLELENQALLRRDLDPDRDRPWRPPRRDAAARSGRPERGTIMPRLPLRLDRRDPADPVRQAGRLQHRSRSTGHAWSRSP